tara:strand:+ start:1115 stop:1549 length:435 start_codon:yes stop_codon:yes gene_type:complete
VQQLATHGFVLGQYKSELEALTKADQKRVAQHLVDALQHLQSADVLLNRAEYADSKRATTACQGRRLKIAATAQALGLGTELSIIEGNKVVAEFGVVKTEPKKKEKTPTEAKAKKPAAKKPAAKKAAKAPAKAKTAKKPVAKKS